MQTKEIPPRYLTTQRWPLHRLPSARNNRTCPTGMRLQQPTNHSQHLLPLSQPHTYFTEHPTNRTPHRPGLYPSNHLQNRLLTIHTRSDWTLIISDMLKRPS